MKRIFSFFLVGLFVFNFHLHAQYVSKTEGAIWGAKENKYSELGNRYIQNLSKDKSYTFKIQGSSGHFEGGVFPNSLRLVGSNIGYPGYSKPISIKIVSESNYHYY